MVRCECQRTLEVAMFYPTEMKPFVKKEAAEGMAWQVKVRENMKSGIPQERFVSKMGMWGDFKL